MQKTLSQVTGPQRDIGRKPNVWERFFFCGCAEDNIVEVPLNKEHLFEQTPHGRIEPNLEVLHEKLRLVVVSDKMSRESRLAHDQKGRAHPFLDGGSLLSEPSEKGRNTQRATATCAPSGIPTVIDVWCSKPSTKTVSHL